MSAHPLKKLSEFGQAIWLDDIHRDLVTSGQLRRLIEEDGLRGMRSNSAIFKKAIADSEDYEADIRASARQGKLVEEIYESLAVEDAQIAADDSRPLYEHSGGEHGYVSIEVNRHLARNTQPTIQEARRLWQRVARPIIPNILIKVSGTREGLPAVAQLLSEGIEKFCKPFDAPLETLKKEMAAAA
jgi:transaldolase